LSPELKRRGDEGSQRSPIAQVRRKADRPIFTKLKLAIQLFCDVIAFRLLRSAKHDSRPGI
jgi:hypothetical protein